jgi:hypothetical protein
MYLHYVISKENKEKIVFFVGVLKATDEKSRIRTGDISQRYVSADPDPYQNVTDPEHWVPL